MKVYTMDHRPTYKTRKSSNKLFPKILGASLASAIIIFSGLSLYATSKKNSDAASHMNQLNYRIATIEKNMGENRLPYVKGMSDGIAYLKSEFENSCKNGYNDNMYDVVDLRDKFLKENGCVSTSKWICNDGHDESEADAVPESERKVEYTGDINCPKINRPTGYEFF
jgi:hypothetical protein